MIQQFLLHNSEVKIFHNSFDNKIRYTVTILITNIAFIWFESIYKVHFSHFMFDITQGIERVILIFSSWWWYKKYCILIITFLKIWKTELWNCLEDAQNILWTCSLKRLIIALTVWRIQFFKKWCYNSQEWRWRKNSSSQQGILNCRQGWETGQKRGENDAEDTTGTQCGPGSSAAGEGQAQLEQGEREREETWGGGGHWFGKMKHYISKRRRKTSARNLGVISEKEQNECRMFSDKYYDELWIKWDWSGHDMHINSGGTLLL